MALNMSNNMGAESGGLEECFSVAGSPIASSIDSRTGAYGYRLYTNGDAISLAIENATGLGTLVGFGVFFDVSDDMLRVSGDGATSGRDFTLELTSSSWNIFIASNASVLSGSYPFGEHVWNFVELYVSRNDSGSATLFINGTLVGSVSDDFSAPTVGTFHILFSYPSGSGELVVDDVYLLMGTADGTALSYRLGGCEIYGYRSNLASATPNTGSDLNSGTWAAVQEIPFNESNVATYTASAVAGSVITDDVGGSAGTGGPNTDNNITGVIKTIKGIWRVKRGTGGGTTHYGLLGNSVDGTGRSSALALSTSYEMRFMLSESASRVPTKNEYGQIGFETTGAQDISCSDMLLTIVHVPSSLPVYAPAYRMQPLFTM